ncbi:hypothetical protein VNO77_46826 [Canavalia gladiata]|uniref:Uncharacterized protein n=1 Tax=Canavalia gladiata TaxID=3824 RepID=A0AAN9JG30_CANGL
MGSLYFTFLAYLFLALTLPKRLRLRLSLLRSQLEREIRSDSKSEFELVLTPKPLPTSDELQVKIESPENFMKMRFALAGSCRREDIPACGRGRGTGLLGRSDKP